LGRNDRLKEDANPGLSIHSPSGAENNLSKFRNFPGRDINPALTIRSPFGAENNLAVSGTPRPGYQSRPIDTQPLRGRKNRLIIPGFFTLSTSLKILLVKVIKNIQVEF
jgi:hypothetical protein